LRIKPGCGGAARNNWKKHKEKEGGVGGMLGREGEPANQKGRGPDGLGRENAKQKKRGMTRIT